MSHQGWSGIAREAGRHTATALGSAAAAMLLVCCGSDTRAVPSSSPTSGGATSASPEASPSQNQGQNQGSESFLDRLVASGDEHLLRVEGVPRAGTCSARALREDSRTDVSGPGLLVAGRRTPQDDGAVTWSWNGDLISIPSAGGSPSGEASSSPSPESLVPVQLVATCSVGGRSRSFSLAVKVSP